VALGAGGIGAIIVSTIINGSIVARDAIHGPVAGAIVCGASSLYITNPVYAFVAGMTGGVAQALIQNLAERVAIKKKLVVSTVSWSLFGIQGIIGAGFAAGWKAIAFTANNNMPVEPATLIFSSQFEFYGGLISAGIGAAFGLAAGGVILLVNGHRSREYFEDYFYWFNYDGVRYEVEEEARIVVKPSPIPVPSREPKPSYKPMPEPEPQNLIDIPIRMDEEEAEFDFSQGEDILVNPYAYL
jgi:hypothetical protein